MADMEASSVPLIIADPPYGIDYQSARRIESDRFDKIANDLTPAVNWLDDAERILIDTGRLICFCRWDVQEAFRAAIEAAGLRIKSQVIWDRVSHGLGDLGGQFAPQHDVIWYATKGRYEFQRQRPISVISIPRVPAQRLKHPNEKPVGLISYLLLRLSTEGDLVFDPFAGAGSTAMAAIKTNRRYLCVEKEAKYCDIARERIRIEQAQLTLDLKAR